MTLYRQMNVLRTRYIVCIAHVHDICMSDALLTSIHSHIKLVSYGPFQNECVIWGPAVVGDKLL